MNEQKISGSANSPEKQGSIPLLVAGFNLQEIIIWTAMGLALTVFFWSDLYNGKSFVGGDVYAYFMPQKTYYANYLKQGIIPLWNDTTGLGYPILGESQTAPLYPPNIVLYYFLDVVTAYNTSHILHYVFAFVGTVFLALHWGYRREVAFFIGFSFVYGWFPVKRCLEWAIITGSFLPWLLLSADLLIITGKRKWGLLLSVLLGCQLLAGHYNLAFISLLAVGGFGLARMFQLMPRETAVTDSTVSSLQKQNYIFLGSALILGFMLAAIQLIPTIELKANSQRRGLTGDYQPAYGHLPLWYLEQNIFPVQFYTALDQDDQIQSKVWHASAAGTNRIEAHFYLGWGTLAMIVLAAVSLGFKNQQKTWFLLLTVVAGVFLFLASGLGMPWLSKLPGFGYFTGPGRYSLVAQLALVLISGIGLQWIMNWLPKVAGMIVLILLVGYSFYEFAWVSDNVYYTVTVEHAPVKNLAQSYVKKELDKFDGMPRVFGPSANMLTIMGFSQVPVYLGIGPQEYWNKETALPVTKEFEELVKKLKYIPAYPERETWMKQAGITHLITFDPLDLKAWDCKLISPEPDMFINSIVGRQREPVYFYKLNNSRGRISWLKGESQDGIKLVTHHPHQVVIETNHETEDTLILAELFYPGWQVSIDDKPAQAEKIEGMLRGVKVPPGQHKVVWNYKSESIFKGSIASLAGIMLLLITVFFNRIKSEKIKTKAEV